MPYVIWKSTDVNSGVIDPDGSVHFYNGAKDCKFVATTLYADGPVVTVTLENNGNITSVEGGDTGVDSIEADFTGVYNVYSLQGFRVMTTNNADELGTLSKGIYIINGKKVMIGK